MGIKDTMRQTLSEDQILEQSMRMEEARNLKADRLLDKWKLEEAVVGKIDEFEDFIHNNPKKARNLAITLENQTKYFNSITEAQTSNAFGNLLPQNLLKIIRLAYPNSIRGDLFSEFAMQTPNDVVYYLTAVYGQARRGVSAGDRVVESQNDQYASEIEREAASGSGVAYTRTTTYHPVRPFTVRVMKGASLASAQYVAQDDGSGTLVGALLNENAANTVVYETGVVTINFTTSTTDLIYVEYGYDSENTDLFSSLGDIDLQLLPYYFRLRSFPLYLRWTKMTELMLSGSLKVDAEQELVAGAADEMRRMMDFMALKLAYRSAGANTPLTFNADYSVKGVDNEYMHAQSILKVIQQAGDVVFNAKNRGGVTAIFGGSAAINFMTMHNQFSPAGNQPRIGAHKVGTLAGIPLYKAPNGVLPVNEVVTTWKNEAADMDSSILFGTYVPLYETQTLEFREQYKTMGLGYYGDYKVTNPEYLVKIQFNGLSLNAG